jgi:hypothetical protein
MCTGKITGRNKQLKMSKPVLAILIPTFIGREWYLERLMSGLQPQIDKYVNDVLLFIEKDNREYSIGYKRNTLIQRAISCGATHRAFIDCDDTVTDNYLDLNMPGVYGDYDCNSLVGVYSINGFIHPTKRCFYHSIKYNERSIATGVWDDATGYYRPPNHLNCTKISLIESIKYNDSNFGEDMTHAMEVAKLGVLKNEYEITEPFYNYLDRTKVNGI